MPGSPRDTVDKSKHAEHTVAEDQRSHGYYYDDAYGYEDYLAEEDEDDERTDIDEDR